MFSRSKLVAFALVVLALPLLAPSAANAQIPSRGTYADNYFPAGFPRWGGNIRANEDRNVFPYRRGPVRYGAGPRGHRFGAYPTGARYGSTLVGRPYTRVIGVRTVRTGSFTVPVGAPRLVHVGCIAVNRVTKETIPVAC